MISYIGPIQPANPDDEHPTMVDYRARNVGKQIYAQALGTGDKTLEEILEWVEISKEDFARDAEYRKHQREEYSKYQEALLDMKPSIDLKDPLGIRGDLKNNRSGLKRILKHGKMSFGEHHEWAIAFFVDPRDGRKAILIETGYSPFTNQKPPLEEILEARKARRFKLWLTRPDSKATNYATCAMWADYHGLTWEQTPTIEELLLCLDQERGGTSITSSAA